MRKVILAITAGLFISLLADRVLHFTDEDPCLSGAAWAETTGSTVITQANTDASSSETRFVDNGNDTVTDRKTGLMWLKTGRPTFGAMSWQNAVKYCNNLNHAGYSDWHVPSREDWETIISNQRENPALADPSAFRNVVTYLGYWTRTDLESSPGYAWIYNLYYGKGSVLNKKKTAFAWPVRLSREIAAAERVPQEMDMAAALAGTFLTEEIQTRYTVIRYRNKEDLVALDRKIRVPAALTRAYYPSARLYGGDAVQRLREKMDASYVSIQHILDMRKRMERLVIEVYPDSKILVNAFKKRVRSRTKSIPAIYDYRRNTIGVNTGAVNLRILGHYMALSIIDHFMPVRPPVRSAKIMAAYVDKQLKP